jgi:glycosyltransferase involved in cell wall biosynthesis
MKKDFQIFYLGAHKVLCETEVNDLFDEYKFVYRAQYQSKIFDQSMVLERDERNVTNLPSNLRQMLDETNFYYDKIPTEIGEILDQYFDLVIVTIHQAWLKNILEVTKKCKILFRTYGQIPLISDLLNDQLGFELANNDRITYSTISQQILKNEHLWYSEKAKIATYSTDETIWTKEKIWNLNESQDLIAALCPNIRNPYYKKYYEKYNSNYPLSQLRFFGIQPEDIGKNDNRILGNLSRADMIENLRRCRLNLYIYEEENVLFLLPVESIILGQPVLYPKRSLLANLVGSGAPGEFENLIKAHSLIDQIRKNDLSLVSEIISSQEHVKEMYRREKASVEFKNLIRSVLDKAVLKDDVVEISENNDLQIKKILILFHFPGNPIIFKDSSYSSFEGVFRVTKRIYESLTNLQPEVEIGITSNTDNLQYTYGYFSTPKSKLRPIKIIDTEYGNKQIESNTQMKVSKKILENIKRNSKTQIIWFRLRLSATQITRSMKNKNRISMLQLRYGRSSNLLKKIEMFQPDLIIIPHYYLFPESLNISKPKLIYVPDYMPHISSDGWPEPETTINSILGKVIVNHCKYVLTNSLFSKNYLPNSKLKIEKNKILVSPLPVLGIKNQEKLVDERNHIILDEKKRYIFYPTQLRPNKDFGTLLAAFRKIIKYNPSYNLILTTTSNTLEKEYEVNDFEKERILYFPGASDIDLKYLYSKSFCLMLTSIAEGNFPPQITEAMNAGCPVICSSLPVIRETTNEFDESLIFCDPGDEDSFFNAILFLEDNYDSIKLIQNDFLEHIKTKNYDKIFDEEIKKIVDSL